MRTTLFRAKEYCCEIQRSENLMQSGRIFFGKICFKIGCFANDDDDNDDYSAFSIHSFIKGCTALCWALASSSVS
jgi:hypothetical protein